MTEVSRRRFLQVGGGSAMTALLAGAESTLRAEQSSAAQVGGDTDRVRFASIGVGIQGSSLLRAAVTLPQGQCVAACDLYDGRHTLAREIAARGHAIENHSDGHRHHFSLLGPRAYDRELAAAQATIADTTGTAPRFFRAPAGLRNVFLQGALERHGLTLTSWTRRGFDTVERDSARVTARLVDGLAAGDILLLHDGHAARTAQGRPVILDVLPPLLARMKAERLRSVTLPEGLDA